jgi:WD40 repeat protein
MKSVGSVLTKDSITTCIDYSTDKLLTSHEDGYIRLWDVRAPQAPTHTFKGHSKLVNSVQFNNRSYLFASVIFLFLYFKGSYDTTVKIWDYRSTFPIQNIGTHHDKVFSVLWK